MTGIFACLPLIQSIIYRNDTLKQFPQSRSSETPDQTTFSAEKIFLQDILVSSAPVKRGQLHKKMHQYKIILMVI